MISQGAVFWLERPNAGGSVQRGRRPHVVVQNDLVNRTAIQTVLVCPLTTNLRRSHARGNVLLQVGEANLTRQSVVNVSQTYAADRNLLTDKIGELSRERVAQIVLGIRLIIEPVDSLEEITG